MTLDPHTSAPSDLDLEDGLDISSALALASFELSFAKPVPLGSAEAILLRSLWISPNADESRVAILLADRRGLRGESTADIGLIASAFAARARACLLDAGATPPPGYINDFPAAPFMASADICSASCAVGFPLSSSAAAMDLACARALDAMFVPGSHFRRHIKLSLAGRGEAERVANKLICELRKSRKS